jgi:hypothetical protein
MTVRSNSIRYISISLQAALLFSLLWITASAQAQTSTFGKQRSLPLNRQMLKEYEHAYQFERDSSHHTSIKPYLKREAPSDSLSIEKDIAKSFGLTISPGADERILLTPLFNITPGFDLTGSSLTAQLEGGLQADVSITKKLDASLSFLGGKSTFPSYLDTVFDSLRVIPGFGRAYGDSSGFSYQRYEGYLSYSPNKVFNFRAGQGHHSWGEGYRSLLLSDYSANYPYLQVSTNIWRLKYVNLYAKFSDMTGGFEKEGHQPKYATFHYLSYNATKWLNLSLFEAIIWQGSDSMRERGYDVNYLNPVIFYRPVEYSLGSSDNALLGGSFKIKLLKSWQLYGQVLLDEFLLSEIRARRGWWGNKQGVQAGVKAFDLFGVKNLYFQAEYNQVRPYTYSHGTVRQSYSHMNLPLAHPLGANFKEVIAFLGYRHNRLSMEGKLLFASYGADSSGINYGHNILQSYASRPSDYGHYTGQGLAVKTAIADLRVAYILSPKNNTQLELRLCERITSTAGIKDQHPFVQLGIRTALWNFYDDL